MENTEEKVISMQEAMDRLYYDNEKINGQLNGFQFRTQDGKKQVSSDGVNWENFNSGAELLWTNPAPTSGFLSLLLPKEALNNYEAVVIEFKWYISYDDNNICCRLYLPNSIAIMASSAGGYVDASTQMGIRPVLIDNNGLNILGAIYSYAGHSPQSFNDVLIPLKIYGLKNALF